MREADHAESRPGAAVPFIHRLACSLVGAQGTIWLSPGSRARDLYGADTATEEYHCNFGLNPAYRSRLEAGKLRVTGEDEAGEARIVELAGHPYFMATLFQPELSALRGTAPHPVIRAFVQVAGGAAARPA